tara:strand:- start:5846 stop:6058 length:213 start_codon:yes stop_codon:yes gene_type:complete
MSVEEVAKKMLELKILPRFMMLVFTGIYMYCIFWFTGLSVEETTAERAALISVVTGAATGSLAVWLGSEK